MKNFYNLYYEAKKLNKKPVNEEQLNNIIKAKRIRCKMNDTYKELKVSDINIVKCTII